MKEKFLFDEGNKVNRPVIRYILEKWAVMESRLQSAVVEDIKFVHSFKVKDEKRVNWVIQLPSRQYSSILNNGKVFMMWRSYRTREYVNITRCYKCHGYGHIAKVCNSPDQLCSVCGSKEHLRSDCPKKNHPECINCTRAKRKDVKHEVHNRDCLEYQRQLELYNNRILW